MSKLNELERTRKKLQQQIKKTITKAVKKETPEKVVVKTAAKETPQGLFKIESAILKAVKPATA